MIRILAPLGGLGFIVALMIAFFTPREATTPTAAELFHEEPKALHLASDGPFGKYNERQLQRGLQVYKEVCAACHSLRLVAFKDLKDLGYTDPEVKKFAADWAVKQPTFDPKTGDKGERVNLSSDKFPMTYYPGQGNPPDMSLLTKAREGGAAYIYSLVTGYADPTPALLTRFPDAKPGPGLYHNPYFANLNIAMPPPLTSDGQVTYADGTKATKDQMAQDVSAFLVWTAEPKLNARHRAGEAVILFLLVFAGLCFASYKSIWADKKH
jgi:ubiquinol-cytochrome c reductase cytochrome c1 subunit